MSRKQGSRFRALRRAPWRCFWPAMLDTRLAAYPGINVYVFFYTGWDLRDLQDCTLRYSKRFGKVESNGFDIFSDPNHQPLSIG